MGADGFLDTRVRLVSITNRSNPVDLGRTIQLFGRFRAKTPSNVTAESWSRLESGKGERVSETAWKGVERCAGLVVVVPDAWLRCAATIDR